MLMRFAILLPTIRDVAGAAIAALFASCDVEFDLFVLRDFMGRGEGHIAAYNAALKMLDAGRHDFVVKMDDDILLKRGWQGAVLGAFERVAMLGVCGLDVSGTDAGHEYMVRGMPGGTMNQMKRYGETEFIEVVEGNVGGVFIVSPTWLVLEVGKMPAPGGVKYPYYGDAWFCHAVKRRGYRTGYIRTANPPELVVYDDPAGYWDEKMADKATAEPFIKQILTGQV